MTQSHKLLPLNEFVAREERRLARKRQTHRKLVNEIRALAEHDWQGTTGAPSTSNWAANEIEDVTASA